jgi:hypothetical protein
MAQPPFADTLILPPLIDEYIDEPLHIAILTLIFDSDDNSRLVK